MRTCSWSCTCSYEGDSASVTRPEHEGGDVPGGAFASDATTTSAHDQQASEQGHDIPDQ